MIVYRSPYRLRAQPERPDPLEGRLRQQLGEARKRRRPVTLPAIGGATPIARDATWARKADAS